MRFPLAFVTALTLAACGGGGGSDSPLNTASAHPAPATFYPAQPTNQVNHLWFSRAELTNSIPITGSTSGATYVWESIYTTTVHGLLPTQTVHCVAQAEVTTPYNYNVQVDRAVALGNWSGSAWPTFINPVAGEDITLNTHHMYINFSVYDETPHTGDVTYSLVLEAASTAALTGDALQVNQGYGGLWCHASTP